MHLLLVVHLAVTLFLVGVIAVVQVVHYPLFRLVGEETYVSYQAEHVRRITWIVLPAMVAELAIAGGIAWTLPLGTPSWMAWTGLGLVGAVWATTGLVHVPLHRRLAEGFDAATHRRLVATNWFRTGVWAARAFLAVWMVARAFPAE